MTSEEVATKGNQAVDMEAEINSKVDTEEVIKEVVMGTYLPHGVHQVLNKFPKTGHLRSQSAG